MPISLKLTIGFFIYLICYIASQPDIPRGTGMSALAICLKQMGFVVTGSDVNKSYFTDKELIKHNIKVMVFDENNIIDKDCTYIASSCYDEHNVEIQKIKNKGYKFFYYSDFIKFFFKGIKIGVCGTHGKTTTTSFLVDAIKDNLCALVGNGRGVGCLDYKYFVFEACEYKENFIKYDYDYLVINNIELDHTDYYNNINEVYEAFFKAANKSKCVIVRDDLNIIHNNKYTFGSKNESFCNYTIIKENEEGYVLKVKVGDKKEIVNYPYYGLYMIENLLGVLCVLYLNNLLGNIQDVIDRFKMPVRRMEEYKYKNNIIITDYAHHPTEIKSLLEAVKQKYNGKRIIVFFQPHTYSRTIDLKEGFLGCFEGVDEVYIDKVFTSNREKYNEEKEREVEEIFGKYARFSIEVINDYLSLDSNVLIFLGAGDIDKYIKYFV